MLMLAWETKVSHGTVFTIKRPQPTHQTTSKTRTLRNVNQRKQQPTTKTTM